MSKVVYVTGCLGFIGYHVTKACLERGWWVRGIDYIGSATRLKSLDLCFDISTTELEIYKCMRLVKQQEVKLIIR